MALHLPGRQATSWQPYQATARSYYISTTTAAINGVTAKYYFSGDTVILENTGSESLYYSYDADAKLISMALNGTEYFCLSNSQGDITGLINTAGT